MHLLIPFAVADAPACRTALAALDLPQLRQLLRQLSPGPVLHLHETDTALPHEHIQAQALGYPAGSPAPWAALRARALGLPGAETDGWAFVTPCHWQVGQAQVRLDHPEALALGEDESRALLAAMQPYFQEDGITLHWERASRWLAQGAVFRGLRSATPERVIGRALQPWLPTEPALRRLQNEMQMLLYTHAVNDAPSARSAQPVNSIWFSGSGALAPTTTGTPTTPRQAPVLLKALMPAALAGDWAAWASAWEALDRSELTALRGTLATPRGAATVQLTLCGENSALTLSAQPRSSWQKIKGLFERQPLSNLWKQL